MVWRDAKKQHQLNVNTYSTIIDGYCKVYDMKNTLLWFDQMEKVGIAPDVVTYNSIIHGYVKKEEMEGALKWFSKMELSRVAPNV